jgi:transglutaminase-like putative cysteine protease
VSAAAILLHAAQVSAWITIAGLALVGWRVAAASGIARLPGGLVRIALGLTLVVAVFAQFHTLNGLAPGTAMLMLMVAIKLLETRTRRDQYIVIGGALFLLLAACLDRQTLAWVPLYGADALLCCSALAIVAYTDAGALPAHANMGVREVIGLAGRTLLYAVPLAVLLFLFFPRLPGHFWAVTPEDDAVTGLGDTLTPGGITRLTSSYDIAFRVRFDGRPPPPEERYWRGPVMHAFDGATWKAGRYSPGEIQRLDCLSAPYRYRIYLEPTFRAWWLALDTVMASPAPNVRYTDDYQLIAAQPVSQAVVYDARSCAHTHSLVPLSSAARAADTQLPVDRNPRTRAWALQLRRSAGSDVGFIRAVLTFLHTGGFSYSLTPPPLGPEPIDDFLFGTRTGFCGHYASAFVDVMRAAGVPARVVTGYLGGQLNPYDGTFIVRQSDAHAWAEVWLDGSGWIRVDPTAVVAPERIYHGILDFLPNAVSASARIVHAWPWLSATLERWDALNGWWNERVVGFNYRAQLNLLSDLGFRSPELRDAAYAFGVTLLVWLAWISWQLGREASLRPRPDLAIQVSPLLESYADLRFGPTSTPKLDDGLRRFERAVARLSIRRGID